MTFINSLAIPNDKMSIDSHIAEGRLPVSELANLYLNQTPLDARGNIKPGDLVVCTPEYLFLGNHLQPWSPSLADVVSLLEFRIEQVAVVGSGEVPSLPGQRYVELGDYLTTNGATGPISGSLFLRLNPGQNPTILRGDNLPTGPESITGIIGQYALSQRVLASR